MKKEELSNFLTNKLLISRRTLAGSVQGKKMKDLINFHTDFLGNDAPMNARCWHLIYNIDARPFCKNCNVKYTKFNSNKWNYLDYCSVKCQRNSSQVKENLERTLQKKYGDGIKNPFQANEVKETIKKRMIDKYGIDHNFKMKEKLKEVIKNKYNVDHYSQTAEFKEKYRTRMQKQFGVDHYSQTTEFREKFKQTCLARLGVEHPMHDPDLLDIVLHKLHKFKDFTLPSGKIVKLQGYEPEVLEVILKSFDENDIYIGKKHIRKQTGIIEYYDFNGSLRNYFPDFYIKSINKIIEVKSTWTFDRCGKLSDDKNINLLKRDACLKMGYDFEFVIFEKS
jgi:hypothetical protein